MKKTDLSIAVFFAVILLASKERKETNLASAQTATQSIQRINTPAFADTGKIQDIPVPEFSDPEVTRFYKAYTAHTIQCVQAIRGNDRAKINAAFENGKQFDNQLQKMEQKARSDANDEQKFKSLIMKLFPYQKEIVQSAHYKKFMEDYYKKVNEKVKAGEKQ